MCQPLTSGCPPPAACSGAIDIDLSLVAESTTSFYMNVASKDDFTVAVKCKLTLNMANFLGEGGPCSPAESEAGRCL